jgi:hypothetical protein
MELDEEKLCRICLETDNLNDFMSPCKCKGTSKYVHRKCIMEWINTNLDNNNSKHCNQCKYEYKYKNESIFYEKLDYFCLFSLSNHFFSFIISLSLLMLCGLFNYITGFYTVLINYFDNLKGFYIAGIFISGVVTFHIIGFLIYLIIYFKSNLPNLEYSKLFYLNLFIFICFFYNSLLSFIVTLYFIHHFRNIIYLVFFKKCLNNKTLVNLDSNYDLDIVV